MTPSPPRLSGIVTAIPTPFDTAGRVDAAAVARLVETLIGAGSGGLCPVGGTGEYTALSRDERRAMVAATVTAAAGRVPVVAGILAPGIADAIEAGRDFIGEGADSLMLVTPYYFRPTPDGIVAYFSRFADRVTADLVLYEIPYRTGVALAPETVARLVAAAPIVAMKACNQDLAQQIRVVAEVGAKIAILSGEEDVFPLHVAMGAVGGILASSNLFPRIWRRILELARAGDLAQSMALHAALRPAIQALFSEPNPAPLKAAFALRGHPMGEVLPPLLPVREATRALLAEALEPLHRREAALG